MRANTINSNKTNHICLFDDDGKVRQYIKDLSLEMGFPRVRRVLTLYYGKEVRLRCDENNLYIGKRVATKTVETWREAKIQSKFLVILLSVFAKAGLKKASISIVFELTFPEQSGFSLTYLNGTLLSKHQFEVRYGENTEFKSETIREILKNEISRSELMQHIGSVLDENLIDDMGVLNEKIIGFCRQSNISLFAASATTFYHQLSSVSNDYSELSVIFELITGRKLVGSEPTQEIYSKNLPSVSIIIPAYELGGSLSKTLKSIDRQNPRGIKFEVIIVDDGSRKPVSDFIKSRECDLSYEPIIIRKEKNSGISQTRNIGAAIAGNDILLFLDGDIVLTPNYLYEHLLRHKLFNKAVLVSFKENVDPDDSRIACEAIEKGVVMPDYQNDLRINKFIDKDTMGYYANNYVSDDGDIFSILAETNYFKSLGFGRRIGNFDLPSMVIGHNLSMPKNLFIAAGGFDNNILGYGLEDSLLGIKSIASGAFVVPVLACGVYHIDHQNRRGSLEEIRKEFERNSEIVAEFLSRNE